MNKRIEEMLADAGFSLISNKLYDQVSVLSVDELVTAIINECATIADQADENMCDCIGANIKSYFGVK